MSDRSAMNDSEAIARKKLIETLSAMLSRELTFFEGARIVFELRNAIGGLSDFDPDFNAFVTIYSETDHLPDRERRHLWSADALAGLESEFEKTEVWAESFAPAACEKLIARFGPGASRAEHQ